MVAWDCVQTCQVIHLHVRCSISDASQVREELCTDKTPHKSNALHTSRQGSIVSTDRQAGRQIVKVTDCLSMLLDWQLKLSSAAPKEDDD